MLAAMGQMSIQRAGQELIQVKDRTIPGRNFLLDDSHRVTSQSTDFAAAVHCARANRRAASGTTNGEDAFP
jgi:hypothetical protein